MTITAAPPSAETRPLDALPRLAPRARSHLVARADAAPGRYLVVHDGGQERLLRLGDGVTHLGRGLAVDVRLEDETVSRRHAIVDARGGAVRILDDRSANGTFVNGHRVADARLFDADVIVLGRVALTYVEIRGSAFSQESQKFA